MEMLPFGQKTEMFPYIMEVVLGLWGSGSPFICHWPSLRASRKQTTLYGARNPSSRERNPEWPWDLGSVVSPPRWLVTIWKVKWLDKFIAKFLVFKFNDFSLLLQS